MFGRWGVIVAAVCVRMAMCCYRRLINATLWVVFLGVPVLGRQSESSFQLRGKGLGGTLLIHTPVTKGSFVSEK
eukprot:635191-Amphidinium_carterae.1